MTNKPAEFLELCREAMREWPQHLLDGDRPASLEVTQVWLTRVRDILPQVSDAGDKALLDLFKVRAQMHLGQLKSDTLRCFFN